MKCKSILSLDAGSRGIVQRKEIHLRLARVTMRQRSLHSPGEKIKTEKRPNAIRRRRNARHRQARQTLRRCRRESRPAFTTHCLSGGCARMVRVDSVVFWYEFISSFAGRLAWRATARSAKRGDDRSATRCARCADAAALQSKSVRVRLCIPR